MAAGSFRCPNCGVGLPAGAETCDRCGLRLRGPDAGRLWQVDQELARLGEERGRLIAALLAPAGQPPEAGRSPTGPRAPRRSLSGQQVLLGLGAVLLLSAASVFLVVVWIVVGLAGQAAIMLALTMGAAAGARWAAVRKLPAAAETAAVLATGLLLIDAWAAHALGLAGLDRIALDSYGAAVTPVLAAALLAADRAVPRRRGDGAVPAVLTYRPAAAAMAALLPWCVLSVAAPQGDALVAALAGVTVVDGAVAVAARRWFPSRRPRLAEAPAAVGALVAAVGFVGVALLVGYDPGRGLPARWTAAVLLAAGLLGPALVVARRISRPGALLLAPVLVVTGGMLVMDAPVAVLVALTLGASALGSARSRWAVPAGLGVAAGYVAVALLRGTDAASLHALSRTGLPDVAPPLDGRDVAVMLLPALAGLALTAYALVRARTLGWIVAAQGAVLVTAVTALLASPPGTWTALTTALAVAEVALAGGAAWRPASARVVEDVARVAAVPYAVLAVGSAATVSAQRTGVVLVVLGVAVLGYAASPRRLAFGYAGSLLVSAGVDTWLGSSDVRLVEAYTLPLAALLAVLGAVQWSQDRTLPTALTVGPALSVAVLPSTLHALSDGNAVRLAAVTAVAVVAVVVGLRRLWRAPVTLGATVLGMVAVTQGGPLIGYVPGWVTLGLAGAVLLAVGVAWERAVLAGRRAHAWYATLH